MKKIKHLMIWIGLLLSLVSCKDTMEAIGLGGDEIPAEGLVLNLQLTNFTKQQIGTRAGTSETVKSLWAVFYGDNNENKGKTDCSKSILSQQPDGSYKVKITNVPAGTKNVHLVANASDMTESEAQDLQSLTAAKERVPQLDAPICWGEISIDKLLEANPSVPMLRQCAKISLEIDKGIQSYFTNAGLYVYNMATTAAIAPANYIEPTTDDLAESTVLRTEDNPLGGGTATTVAVNETSAGKAMVIIKANYKKSEEEDYREGYYKVALYKNDKKAQYALLRNHHYTIKVIKVNDYGFSTLDEAKKSLPENRVEVEVVDDNPEITQMIACKDYELGVSDYQEVDASTEEATVTIVTTLPKATSSDGKLYDVKINNSWITDWQQETENNIQETSSSSKGKKYTLKLTLEKNNQSENPRTGTITVTSGDLSLDITIKQTGFDFRKDDPERPVTMQYNNSTVAPNYFNWLDGVQGITPADMQGAVRNDGLHFCVGTANITYLIHKLDGDKITNTDNRINVKEDNGNWKVSLTNTTANEDLWKSSFIITNKAGIEITYPVYHTGIFHKIDESSKIYTDYQLTENGDNTKKVKGWFYYGVVKVEGKKTDETTTTYYMLDRNLGASNNGYYAPDVVALEKNKKAIGGYFCISEKKSTSDASQDLSSALAPEGYTIPTDAVFEELVNAGNLEVVPQSTSLGETYNCVRIKTVDSELPYIYLPMGGFLEGESHKNPIHVNLWTKTLLSGTQGFSADSPEYGFWYRYFDVYNKRIGLSNMRFVSGSNGKNNGRYKGMPIRLILK